MSENLPLERLSSAISVNAFIVSRYLGTNHLPQLSFEAEGPSVIIPVNASPNVQLARQRLHSASLELFQLATGPSDFLPNLATGVSDLNIIKPLFEYSSDYSFLIPLLPDLALLIQYLSPCPSRCLD